MSIGWFQDAVGEAQTGARDFLAFFWGVGDRGSAFSFPHAAVSLVSYKNFNYVICLNNIKTTMIDKYLKLLHRTY